MKRLVLIHLLAAHGAALALALAVSLPERAVTTGVWRYASPQLAARAHAAPAGPPGAIAQCLWPRAAHAGGPQGVRAPGAEAGIGLAFCLRAPETHPRAHAAAAARRSYRT
jgi:hypothetical protein